MARKLLSHPYEKGCSESWAFKTDILTSADGTEQRIGLLPYPKETVTLTIAYGDDGQQVFDGEPEISGQAGIIRNLGDLLACGGEVEIPLWHLSDNISTAAWTTGTQIADLTLPAATPFHVFIGEDVLVDTGTLWRRAEVTAYSQTGATLTVDFGSNTGAAIADLVELAPLRTGLVANPASITLGRAAHVSEASVSVLLDRSQGRTGFSGSSSLSTATPNSWPLLNLRGIQGSMDLQVDHGLQTIAGPTGFPYYSTDWSEPKIGTKFRDEFSRRSPRFRFWRTFLSTVHGSQGGFWLPTRRGEFTVLTSDSDLQIITIEGRQFFDLWSETNLKAICLDDLGDNLAVVQVTACELSGDNSVLALAEGWFEPPVLQCSIALPCRIKDDRADWTHEDSTVLELQIVSLPYEFPVIEQEVDWEGLLAQIDSSSAFAEFDRSGRYVSVPIAGELGGEVTVIAGKVGADQSPVNFLRAMGFEDEPFDPTLGGTLAVHVWADTLLAQFRQDQWGPGDQPDMVFDGEGEVPNIFILPGGDPEVPEKSLGEARYVRAWADIDDPLGPSRSTAPIRYEDGYELHFADTTYFSPSWQPLCVGLNDRSGNDNHLTADPPVTGARAAAAARYLLDSSVLECTFAEPLPATAKLVVLVGHIDALPGAQQVVALLDSSTDCRVRIEPDGGVHLNRGATSASVGTLANGDHFLLLAAFNGASSSIHLLKNDETTWASSTVDDGGGAFDAIVGCAFGWGAGFSQHAAIIVDLPSDLTAYREGLARHYLFESLVSQTGVQATTSDADGWKVVHDGTTDYVLSVALEIKDPGPATITLFEVLNDAENGGLRWEWVKATNELAITYIGTAGTFADSFDLTDYVGLGYPMIVETIFDASSEGATVVVNGEAVGVFVASGFTFSTVQQNALRIGEDRGWVFCELLLNEGAETSTDYLANKWQAVTELLMDEGDELLMESSELVVGW